MSTGFALRNNRVQSLGRALEMLDLLANAGGEVGGTELARLPEVRKSTASRLVAAMPPDDRPRLPTKPLPPLTARTLTERSTMENQLPPVREDGYSFTLEELEVGLNAVAAPVRDSRGEVLAAVSVSGPSYRVSPQRLSELGEMTHEAAEAISRRMGFIPSPTGGGKA